MRKYRRSDTGRGRTAGVIRTGALLFSGLLLLVSAVSGAVIRGPSGAAAARVRRHQGELYIPFSAVVEAYGLYRYEFADPGYVFSSRFCRLALAPSSREVEINGERVFLDAPVEKIDGQIFVPLYLAIRVMAERISLEPPPPLPETGRPGRRVVIDPGHGGRDTGAIGAGGTEEKEVVLSIALRVGSLLEIRGYEVLMTRDRDEYIPLPVRVMTANQAGGDLFVSIHSNAAENLGARGPETFYYSSASDRFAAELARLENLAAAADDLHAPGEWERADPPFSPGRIGESRRLAGEVQKRLAGLSPENDRGVRTAEFFVLRHTQMPAILVEAGFLTNRIEEDLLADLEYQERIAEAIAAGIDNYFQ